MEGVGYSAPAPALWPGWVCRGRAQRRCARWRAGAGTAPRAAAGAAAEAGAASLGKRRMELPVARRAWACQPATWASNSAPMRGLRARAEASADSSSAALAGGLSGPSAPRRTPSCATAVSSGSTHWYTGQLNWPRAEATAGRGRDGWGASGRVRGGRGYHTIQTNSALSCKPRARGSCRHSGCSNHQAGGGCSWQPAAALTGGQVGRGQLLNVAGQQGAAQVAHIVAAGVNKRQRLSVTKLGCCLKRKAAHVVPGQGQADRQGCTLALHAILQHQHKHGSWGSLAGAVGRVGGTHARHAGQHARHLLQHR